MSPGRWAYPVTQLCHSVGLQHMFSGLGDVIACIFSGRRRPVRSGKGDFCLESSGVRSHQPAGSLSKGFDLQNLAVEGRTSVMKMPAR